ncbi:MAG: hypothetical protein IKC39_01765 [Clostridia bacterium]|nr:hypothetical protein [Clostridia bacterium]
MKKTKAKLSRISILHYIKLVVRSLLFVGVLVYYILGKTEVLDEFHPIPIGVCIYFTVEMIFRFFPSKLESMGCQKQFARNYEPIGDNIKPQNQSWKRTFLVAVVWLALNGIIGLLYFADMIDEGILVLIAIAYSVCDIICILFFCPFQTWFMKNRCCATCRIYNWDFAMMFTPLVFIPSVYTYTLLGFSLLLLLRWEITYKLHPERFATNTNKCLDCSNCQEKLCSHKTQLQSFLKKYRTRFFNVKK